MSFTYRVGYGISAVAIIYERVAHINSINSHGGARGQAGFRVLGVNRGRGYITDFERARGWVKNYVIDLRGVSVNHVAILGDRGIIG